MLYISYNLYYVYDVPQIVKMEIQNLETHSNFTFGSIF